MEEATPHEARDDGVDRGVAPVRRGNRPSTESEGKPRFRRASRRSWAVSERVRRSTGAGVKTEGRVGVDDARVDNDGRVGVEGEVT